MRIDARVTVRDFIPKDGELRKTLSNAVRVAAFQLEARAKVNAPVDTGFLRNSIQATVEPGALEAEVAAGAQYAVHVEYGTGNASAQPFMTPAADAVKPKLERTVASVLRKIGKA